MQVIMTNNFNDEATAYEFNDESIAKAFVHWLWEDTVNDFKGYPNWKIDEDLTFHEEEYAQVSFIDGDQIRIELAWNASVPTEFYDVCERYML